MVTILDPRGEPGVPVIDYTLAAAVSRAGLMVGLVSNGFPGATSLLTAVGDALPRVLTAPDVTLYARRDPSSQVAQEMADEVEAHCSAVVTAMGHCGSCTSSAERDAVTFARRGVPAVALVSEKFWDSAAFVARSVGMPTVPRVKLPHPVTGTGHDNIVKIADGIVDEIVRRLGGAA